MARFAWWRNAARRTWRSLAAAQANPDDDYARDILPPVEFRLYLAMDPRDREHAIEIARTLQREDPQATDVLLRAALLHDVGKQGRPYLVWERVLAHLWSPQDIPATPRFRGLRGAWQVRVHHAAYGAELLRQAGGSEEVAQLIAEHDAAEPGPEARKLQKVDERT